VDASESYEKSRQLREEEYKKSPPVIQAHHRRQIREKRPGTPHLINRLVCKDGFSMSVQASADHGCTPRTNLTSGQYTHWEVGFPRPHEPLLAPYIDALGQIANYVPTHVIDRIIHKHGGLK